MARFPWERWSSPGYSTDPFAQQTPNANDPFGAIFGGKWNPNAPGTNTGVTGYGFPYGVPTPSVVEEPKSGGSSGDWQQEFNRLIQGVAPTTENLKNIVFPAFQQLFPNAKLDRGDIDPFGNGQYWDVLEAAGMGGRNWQMLEPGGGGYGGGYSGTSEFSDPLTAKYEELLNSQIAMYQQQQREMQAQEGRRQAARQQTQARAGDLTKYLEERVKKLEGPAFSGQEADILRTQLTDPVERDRTASQQRALQNIGSRGFDPTSGIAQELLQGVNRAYDEERARRTGGLAEQSILEQRSREQEAQQLMQYLTELPMAVETGDINFMNAMQQAVNSPGREALSAGRLLANLPSERLQDALAALGMSKDPTSGYLSLLNQYGQNRQSNQGGWADYWGNIGASFLPRR